MSTPIPTLSHIPTRARAKWSRVVIRALAAIVLYNSVASWTELLMLPKTVLCHPQGTKHSTESLASFTLDRLDRWEIGERSSLWADAVRPSARSKRNVNNSWEFKQARAEDLCREGLDGKACAMLQTKGLVTPSRQTARELEALHPRGDIPPRTPLRDLALPPDISPALVWKMLCSFPKGTSPGPTGLRASHLLEACTLSNKALVLEQLVCVVRNLALGSAPRDIVPFLGGARLLASPK